MVARKALKVALAFLPVLVGGAATYWVYRTPSGAYVDFERRFEGGFISGFHGHERMEGRGFRWSTGDSRVRLENLPAQTRLRVEVRVKGLRPRDVPLPQIRFTANGATVFETLCAPGLVTYRFGVTLRGNSLELGIHPDVFVPADYQRGDDRVLGVQVFSVSVQPQGGASEWAAPARDMMLGGGVLLAAGLLAGLSIAAASVAASLLIGGFAYFLAQDSVMFSLYPQRVLWLAGATLVAAGLLRLVLARAKWLTPRERSVLIGVLSAGLFLKLGGLFYPLFFSSDAEFHANRLLEVLEGNFFTVSVTQHDPSFRIPYPISLYVLAAPVSALGMDSIAVLKTLTALADLGVSLMLAFFGARFLHDPRGGILGAALYQLVPLNFLAFSAGNFTNLFGAAVTVFFLALLLAAASGASSPGRARWLLAGVLLTSLAALTAHFGSFLYGMLLWPAWLAALFWMASFTAAGPHPRGTPSGDSAPAGGLRTPRTWEEGQEKRILVAVGASVVAACVYYLGYMDLFTTQWQRVLSRDYATGAAATEGPMAKLLFNWAFFREQVGTVFALVALLGAIPVLRKAGRTAFHAAAVAWLGATGAFFLLDLTTALEVRYVLQVLPLLALFVGSFLSGAFARGMVGRVSAITVVGYLAVMGLRSYAYCLLERYH